MSSINHKSEEMEISLCESEDDTFCSQNQISAEPTTIPPEYTETKFPGSYVAYNGNATVNRETPFWLKLQLASTSCKEESNPVVDSLHNIMLYLSIIILLMLVHMNFFSSPT